MTFSSKENRGSIFAFTFKLENIESKIETQVNKVDDMFQLNSNVM